MSDGGKQLRTMRILDAKTFLRIGALPFISTALGVGLAIYFVYLTTRFRLANVWPLAPIGDAAIMFDQGRLIFELGDYPARLGTWPVGVFPYPPSAVLFFHWLGAGGPGLFMGGWFAAMAAGLVTTLRASLAGERHDIRAAWLMIAGVALIFADNPVSWDLRNSNSNLVYLGLVASGHALMTRRPSLAGVLVGLSIALKLYSGLLLLWLLFRGSWRALLASTGTVILLAVVWPIATWGTGGSVQMYFGWLEQLKIIADPQVHAAQAALAAAHAVGPPIVSLGEAAMALTGEGPLGTATRAVVSATWVIWIAAIIWYVRRAIRSFPAAGSSRAALADWTVLLLAPLPFSPWLEPYHAIPMLPGAILFVLVALDERVSAQDRQIAIAALAALLMTRIIHLPFVMRGLLLLMGFLVVTVALALLRPRLLAASESRRATVLPNDFGGGPPSRPIAE